MDVPPLPGASPLLQGLRSLRRQSRLPRRPPEPGHSAGRHRPLGTGPEEAEATPHPLALGRLRPLVVAMAEKRGSHTKFKSHGQEEMVPHGV